MAVRLGFAVQGLVESSVVSLASMVVSFDQIRVWAPLKAVGLGLAAVGAFLEA